MLELILVLLLLTYRDVEKRKNVLESFLQALLLGYPILPSVLSFRLISEALSVWGRKHAYEGLSVRNRGNYD